MDWIQPAKSFVLLLLSGVAVFTAAGLIGGIKSHASDTEFKGSTQVQRWVASELRFTSPVSYKRPFYDVDFDFTFTNRETGTTLKIPAFWDGEENFTVRYALTETGTWDYTVQCSDESNALNGKDGVITCQAYDGEYEIYKRGFLKTQGRHFIYADGTPFFYLGDTHWHMALEDNKKEIVMEDGVTATRFAYTLQRRYAQGFTVIQSEPLGEYDGSNDFFKNIFTQDFNKVQLRRFQMYDRYFSEIAAKGFVHANAQFSYATSLGDAMQIVSDDHLARLCRYWTARYSAYPVLWTLSQECDNDYYYGQATGQNIFTAESNPWKKVAVYMSKYDPYCHPLTAHQENSANTLAYNSAFSDINAHNWWAAQINYDWKSGTQFDIYKDYWDNGAQKPGVEYEGRYDHFWTGTWGARLQGWMAFLNGMYGYGYGSAKIWSANDKPGIWAGALQQTVEDGLEVLTYKEIDITWQQSLNLPAAQQMGHMKAFFSEYEWWRLEPCFSSTEIFEQQYGVAEPGKNRYASAHIDDDVYITYFYNTGKESGVLKGLKNSNYQCKWYNPCTGEYNSPYHVAVDSTGILQIGDKPDGGDWVFVAVNDPVHKKARRTRIMTGIAAVSALTVLTAVCTGLIVARKGRKRGGK